MVECGNSGSPWPLVPYPQAELDPNALACVNTYARRYLKVNRRSEPDAVFGADVGSGCLCAPLLVFEDHQSIELMPADRLKVFEYRSYCLARTGDFVVLSRSRVPAFEAYWAELRATSPPTVLEVTRGPVPAHNALATACLDNEEVLDVLVNAAEASNGFNLSPYISDGHTWLLAAEISRRASVPVRVLASPPWLSRLANDKLWFASLVKSLLGREALPPTFSVFGPAAAAAVCKRLASASDRVVAKLCSSAGSMGNTVLDSAHIRTMTVGQARSHLLERISATGWSGAYPILIGVWEAGVSASPSVQMWVPGPSSGPPIIEGVFGQELFTERQAFVGAVSLRLADDMQGRLCREAKMIATTLQHLGYFGRLSLDALLIESSIESANLHWIECNARWGGVSIPMTLSNLLSPHSVEEEILVVQRGDTDSVSPSFERVRDAAAQFAFELGTTAGVVFIQPTGPDELGLNFLVRGEASAERASIADHVLNMANLGQLN